MSVADVYGFEQAIEPAIGSGLVKAGITCYTSQGKIKIDGTLDPTMDFKKDRPRVELVFTKGAGRGRLFPGAGETYEQHRESAWSGTLSFAALTIADPGVHFAYLAQIRFLCSTIPNLVNGTLLTHHKIQFPARDQGESHTFDPGKGIFVTKLNYAIDVSIQADAWALLVAPNPIITGGTPIGQQPLNNGTGLPPSPPGGP